MSKAAKSLFLSTTILLICVSVTSFSAKADAVLVDGIDGAAFEAFEELPSNADLFTKTPALTTLAKALVDAGDLEQAQRVLARARAIGAKAPFVVPEIFVLSIQAGDKDGAMAFISKADDVTQLQAFEKLAVGQAQRGDLAGVDATLALAAALRAKAPREPAAQEETKEPQVRHFQFTYDYLFCNVGKAFAANGNIPRALAFTDQISNPLTRYVLLRAVAKAQHKAGDEAGVDASLRLLVSNVEKFYAQKPVDMAWAKALSFGEVGAAQRARAVVDALPRKEDRDALYARLSETLARAGDITQAREIAETYGQIDNLILIGNLQVQAGNDAEGRKMFLAAHDAAGHSNHGLTGTIYGLISAGAFSEGVALAAGIDELNRPPFLLKAISEEARRGDAAAMRETAPFILELLQAPKVPLREQEFTDLIDAFTQMGLTDDAQSARLLAEKNSARLRLIGRNLLSSGQLRLKEIDDDIARHDLSAAAAKVPSLSGTLKDSGIEHLALAQADSGQPKIAFETAKSIVDPYQRGAILTRIIGAASKASP